MEEWYKEDLAFIHDAGFGEFARRSAPGLLDLLKLNGVESGLVIDLGCRSGIWAEILTMSGLFFPFALCLCASAAVFPLSAACSRLIQGQHHENACGMDGWFGSRSPEL